MKIILLIFTIEFYLIKILCSPQVEPGYGIPNVKQKVWKYCIYSDKQLDVGKWDYDWKDESENFQQISTLLQYQGLPYIQYQYNKIPYSDLDYTRSDKYHHNLYIDHDHKDYNDHSVDHHDDSVDYHDHSVDRQEKEYDTDDEIANSADYLVSGNYDHKHDHDDEHTYHKEDHTTEIITTVEQEIQTEPTPKIELVTEIIDTQSNITFEESGSSQDILVSNNTIELIVESLGSQISEVITGTSEQINSTDIENVTIVNNHSDTDEDCDHFHSIPLDSHGNGPDIELIANSTGEQIGVNFEEFGSSQDKLTHEDKYEPETHQIDHSYESNSPTGNNHFVHHIHFPSTNGNTKNHKPEYIAHNNYGHHYHFHSGSYFSPVIHHHHHHRKTPSFRSYIAQPSMDYGVPNHHLQLPHTVV